MRDLLKNSTQLLSKRQNNILTAAATIMVTFGVSHLIGLLKTRLLISYFFGTNAESLDAYYAAFALPDTIFQLLVIGSLSAAFIPVFTRHLGKNESEAWTVASSVFNLVILTFVAVSLVLFTFSHQLAPLIAPGFTTSQHAVLSNVLRLMLVAQFFFSISGFLTAMIQSHQRFIVPALAPIAYNFGIIAGIVLLSPVLGIYGPAVGAVFGSLLHMCIQLPLAFKLGFRPTWAINLKNRGLREVLRLMPPRALALGVDQLEQVVSVILASTMAAGSLSILNVARLLYLVPASLFGVTIGQAALPTLSRQSNDNDRSEFRHTLINSLLQVIFLALPICTLLIVLRIPVVRLVFGAKSFPWPATLLTGKVLALLALSGTFIAAQQLINRGYYALHDTSTPLRIGLVAALVNVFISIFVVNVLGWGVMGLAMVISATTAIETIVLLSVLSVRLQIRPSRLLIPISKMAITTIITGVSLWVPMRFLDQFVFDTTRTLPLIALTGITTAIGMGMYLFLSYLFRVDELSSFLVVAQRLYKFRELLTKKNTPVPVAIPPSNGQ